jgi:hypothetical protein
MATVAAACRRLGIPPLFFARGVQPPEKAVNGDYYKPLWVDIRNPFCLDLLANTASHVEWVVLEEMLPSPEEIWSPFSAAAHVSELLVEMIL